MIDDGRVVGQGSHQELLKNCKIYQEIAQSQLSENELKASVGSLKTMDAGDAI